MLQNASSARLQTHVRLFSEFRCPFYYWSSFMCHETETHACLFSLNKQRIYPCIRTCAPRWHALRHRCLCASMHMNTLFSCLIAAKWHGLACWASTSSCLRFASAAFVTASLACTYLPSDQLLKHGALKVSTLKYLPLPCNLQSREESELKRVKLLPHPCPSEWGTEGAVHMHTELKPAFDSILATCSQTVLLKGLFGWY